MINHLCHMGGRYFVTMIPGRMEMYWGSMLMCATYMAMFWGITLWLAVCVRCVALVEGCLGSRVGYQGIPDLGRVCEWSVSDQLAREFPNWNEHHWKRTRSYSSLEKTDSKPIHICVSKIIIIGSDNYNNNHHCFRVSRDVPPFRHPFSPQVHPLVGYSNVKHTPVAYHFIVLSHSLWVGVKIHVTDPSTLPVSGEGASYIRGFTVVLSQ